MSTKVIRGKKKEKNSFAEIIAGVMEYIVAMVLVVMVFAVAFYAEDGYYQIGNAKFDAYCRIMLPGMSLLLVMELVYLIGGIRGKAGRSRSVTDWFVLAYLVLTVVSAVCGGCREDALWGSRGWNMGMLAQLSFVLLYFFVSHFGRWYRSILAALGAASFVVFGIGILHRLMIDPIGYYEGLTYEQKAQFLSTLGQATWYASFLIVLLPVGAVIFLYSEKRYERILGGIWLTFGIATLVTQNSDSAYVAFFGFMLVFLWDAVQRRETLLRYVEICTGFWGIGRIMGLLLRIRPNPAFVPDVVSQVVLYSAWGWVFLAAGAVCCGILIGRREKAGYPQAWLQRGRNMVYLVTGAGLLFSVEVLVWGAAGGLPAPLEELTGKISYLRWGDDWGNARGRIWTFAAQVFREESLWNKLCGVGPDCLNAYVKANYAQELALFWGEKTLTNAHNEWFTMLINGGIMGLAAYAGIFVTLAGRCMKRREDSYLLTGVAAAVVSYMAYNFFCYQQVLCTPFLFILMGIGEYLLRRLCGVQRTRVDKTGSDT